MDVKVKVTPQCQGILKAIKRTETELVKWQAEQGHDGVISFSTGL